MIPSYRMGGGMQTRVAAIKRSITIIYQYSLYCRYLTVFLGQLFVFLAGNMMKIKNAINETMNKNRVLDMVCGSLKSLYLTSNFLTPPSQALLSSPAPQSIDTSKCSSLNTAAEGRVWSLFHPPWNINAPTQIQGTAPPLVKHGTSLSHFLIGSGVLRIFTNINGLYPLRNESIDFWGHFASELDSPPSPGRRRLS